MIELSNNGLIFRFPEVHTEAICSIDFQRTLRIPDDNREHHLPPGLGRFPVEHVEDYAEKLPEDWRRHGGVFLPMYQSEALWINFSGDCPCAIKVAAGRINAVSGKEWTNSLSGDPQDYVVVPAQPWLDGFKVSEGHIRQFVAMPLGDGFTAEEQITGKAEHGGIQIVAYPMKRDVYLEWEKERKRREEERKSMVAQSRVMYSPAKRQCLPMGLAPGGLMRQKIYRDSHGIDVWDQENGFRCFVHIANSAVYEAITGHPPPDKSPTAKDYTDAGLPWFDYYSDAKPLPGSDILAGLSSVGAKMIEEGKGLLADNDPVQPTIIRTLGRG